MTTDHGQRAHRESLGQFTSKLCHFYALHHFGSDNQYVQEKLTMRYMISRFRCKCTSDLVAVKLIFMKVGD